MGELHVIYSQLNRVGVICIILGLTVLLAACGGSSETGNSSKPAPQPESQVATNKSEDEPTDTSESTSATAEKAEAPRTIPHLKGELTLTETPQNIVVLDVQYVDQFLALGLLPSGSVVATTDNSELPKYLGDQLGDIQIVGTREDPNLEAIIALEPDLIISTEFQDKVYEDLLKIAPVLKMERNEDWRSVLQTFGTIVNKPEVAKKVLSDYDAKIEELKGKLADKLQNETVALIRPRDNIVRLHMTSHRTSEILYVDLGLNPPPMAVDSEQTSLPISLEVLPELGADHLFLLRDDTNVELTEEFQKTSIWKNLKPVQNNQIYDVNTVLWVGYYGPTAINMIIDQIAETFAIDLGL
ncbi:iron-siderophore ABC transporter substrate-binding protein [Paenibacillaceae bacterium]|nr:iron-siderophore ABC transporter substrate-binding protein [Paenibacillaceae bacterium]